MSDIEFLSVCLLFTAIGYAFSKIQDQLRQMSERHQREERQRQAFIKARRTNYDVTFHPLDLKNIQERAELDDLRDYIRSTDA